MSTALANIDNNQNAIALPDNKFWVMPDSLKEAMELSTIIAGSSLCPKNFQNKPGDVFVAAKFGQALGLSIMQSVIAIAVINGRPGIFGDDMLAVVQSHPAYEGHKEFYEGDGDKLTAIHQIKRRGQEVHEVRFSVADAKRAGLWDDRAKIPRRDGGGEVPNPAPWHCYPKRMLMFRARGFGLRDKFADALRGMKSVEELQDYPTIEGSFQVAEEPPAKSAPTAEPPKQEPVDACISPEQANELGRALKASGYNVKESREYFKTTLGVDTSLHIKASQYEAAMAFARIPKPGSDGQPATNGNGHTEPKAAAPEENGPYAQQFGFLGWNKEQCDEYMTKMSKFSEAQIRADLNRLIEAQDNK